MSKREPLGTCPTCGERQAFRGMRVKPGRRKNWEKLGPKLYRCSDTWHEGRESPQAEARHKFNTEYCELCGIHKSRLGLEGPCTGAATPPSAGEPLKPFLYNGVMVGPYPEKECPNCGATEDEKLSWNKCHHAWHFQPQPTSVRAGTARELDEMLEDEIRNLQRNFESLGTVNDATAANLLRPAFKRFIAISDGLQAKIDEMHVEVAQLLQERDALKERVESQEFRESCAKTPLMADVIEARERAESALGEAREALGDLRHAAKDVIYNLPDGEYAGLGNLRSTVKQVEKLLDQATLKSK